ncbi:hypothetical protein [Vibrio sp. T11.5]|nr:hypothetical protein [Vibrio sp. T11.5]MDA0120206.1 hypothetical protein [Vibrio sp. T11.5]
MVPLTASEMVAGAIGPWRGVTLSCVTPQGDGNATAVLALVALL